MSLSPLGPHDGPLDCVVIGGGPAGLTAAAYLARARRRTLLIDACESRARWIPTSHNTPGFPEGVTGERLLARLRAQADRHGARALRATVTAATRGDDGLFAVETQAATVKARRIILATGVVDREPPLPDAFDAVKRQLLKSCPICDGYESAGRAIAVLGNCEHAAAEALFIRTYSDRITVISIAGRISDKRRQELDSAGITLVEAQVEAVEVRDGRIACLWAGGQRHDFDVLYTALGVDARSELAGALGVDLGEDGRMDCDLHGRTNVEHVWGAGDIVHGLNQIAVAVGEGAAAAIDVHNSLPRNFA